MLPTQSSPNVARKAEIVYIIKSLSFDHDSDSSQAHREPWWRRLLTVTPRANPQDGDYFSI